MKEWVWSIVDRKIIQELFMSNTIDLTLDGLSCGHCVKRVKESLEQRPDVEQAEVTLTEAHVTGSASAQALIDTVKQAGYGAGSTTQRLNRWQNHQSRRKH